ncbi:MAG: tRNA (guanosine(46)-N7)-methyltransferase TrmB [Clostridia bacterium]|nr:tRNA (guanosine(46)-N7)-methyltransferase TrmB [Clostridia bacterium]
MRMRRKKNLEQKIAACGEYLIQPRCESLNFNETGENEQISLIELFGNDAPVILEVGAGKGKFAAELAYQHPEYNILAVEKDSSVCVDAVESIKEKGVKNARVMKLRAEYLARILPLQSISRIYLNFSCPFPKNTYASHRLTAPRFLEIYRQILKPDGEIHQKTDNMRLFEFSIESFSQSGYSLKNVSLDLHNSAFEGNIMTEYETKFVSMGLPIYRLEAYLPEKR